MGIGFEAIYALVVGDFLKQVFFYINSTSVCLPLDGRADQEAIMRLHIPLGVSFEVADGVLVGHF